MKELNEVMMGMVYARWGMILGGTAVAFASAVMARKLS